MEEAVPETFNVTKKRMKMMERTPSVESSGAVVVGAGPLVLDWLVDDRKSDVAVVGSDMFFLFRLLDFFKR